MIAWYPFNGNANDESGNANHGTVNGATLTSDRFSRADNAYYFNGSNNISVKSNEQLNLIGDMSLSLWFYSEGPPEFRTNHSLISKIDRDDPNGPTAPYAFSINYQFNIPSDYKKPLFVTAINGDYQYLQSSMDITNNAWNHAVAVVNGENLKIYINNILYLDTTIDNAKRATNAVNLLFGSGNRRDAPAEYLEGKLDDIAIYNRPLTISEISALFDEGIVNAL